jgi:hypothetical protein
MNIFITIYIMSNQGIINMSFIFIILIMVYRWNIVQEDMINIKPIRNINWKRNKCKYLMNKTTRNIIKKHNFNKTSKANWNLHFPCTYNNIKNEISQIKPFKKHQRIFILDNADQISSKQRIWNNLVKMYNRDGASTLMPMTYSFNKPTDVVALIEEFDKNKIYILKKNIQRQKGLKITNKLDDILKATKQGYVIAQELLQDPYIIDTRKTNMRFYVLVICNKKEIDTYVHNDGFMYYTKVPFKKNSLTDECNITTGYIDRAVYEKNPLTHNDFRKYLDKNRDLNKYENEIVNKGLVLSDVIFNRINNSIKKIMLAIQPAICNERKLSDSIAFQLFGVDIALSDSLIPKIMEANKGPDLGTKDGRDSHVKHKVVEDMFKTVKLIDDNDNGFQLV